ncbi:murein hydrolase activator EnvC family protein [Sphaerimonospora sp. CA-214678]|uniref:murein hydrolase activator EnvC family protein n=1 Tax=Sphaerimonospora sp. CA-214678 TaxID=3240029 RepID=UPI003D8A6AE0
MRSVICLLACLVTTLSGAGPVSRPPLPAGAADGPDGGSPAPAAAPWRRPLGVRGQVIRGFDPPPRPWLAGHRGVDLAARAGDEVRAAGPGIVGYAGRVAGRGVVVIAHQNGLRTTYLPVRASVAPGGRVAAGDVIGVVEDVVGHCRRVCLHWGLLRGRSYLDPLALFGLGRVRLLPSWPGPGEGQARG